MIVFRARADRLIAHGLEQLGRADGRIAQPRRRCDSALGLGRVREQTNIHASFADVPSAKA